MRAIVLYSPHVAGQAVLAQEMAHELGAYAAAVDLEAVYGTALADALRHLLGVRDTPAVILVQDHLQGAAVEDLSYLAALAAEQMDIESREYRQVIPGHLRAELEAAREEVRAEVRGVDRAGLLPAPAQAELRQRRVLPSVGGE